LTVLTPGIPARAATVPYFLTWQPGTAVPTIPAGYTALALPSSAVLAHLQPGETVPTTPVANTAALQSAAPTLTTANGGEPVNLELIPATPASTATASPAPTASGSAQAAPASAESPDASCGSCCAGTIFLEDLGYSWGNVGESFSEIPGATQAFQYSQTHTQGTTFGVGISATGDAGSFDLSGTISFTTDHTATVGWPRETGVSYNAWATTYDIGLYHTIATSGNCSSGYYWAGPYAWSTGEEVTHPTSPPALNANNCRPYQNGGTFQGNASTASTIAHGYDVKGGTVANLGFTESAQTGYSVNAQVGFSFSQNGYLCGNNAPPPDAGLYVAHA
jgi:hypothetical protein